MIDPPDKAIAAAAQAIYKHSLLVGKCPRSQDPIWLGDPEAYREIARVALIAALPYLSCD